jgi:hypothetical protein
MDLLQVLFTSAALLLGYAGVQKLRDPYPVAGALRLAHLPHRGGLVRALASVEIAAAAGALTVHSRLVPVAVTVLYASFAVFVTWALAHGLPIESCECFGRCDSRPSASHVALNAFAATIAVLVAIDDTDPVRVVIADHPAKGLARLAVSAILASTAAAWLRGSRVPHSPARR